MFKIRNDGKTFKNGQIDQAPPYQKVLYRLGYVQDFDMLHRLSTLQIHVYRDF